MHNLQETRDLLETPRDTTGYWKWLQSPMCVQINQIHFVSFNAKLIAFYALLTVLTRCSVQLHQCRHLSSWRPQTISHDPQLPLCMAQLSPSSCAVAIICVRFRSTDYKGRLDTQHMFRSLMQLFAFWYISLRMSFVMPSTELQTLTSPQMFKTILLTLFQMGMSV